MAIVYSEAATLYADEAFQGRAKAAIAEQAGQTYVADADPAKAGLAKGVLGGNDLDIDALVVQVTVAPTAGDKATVDLDLLAAVQWAWGLIAYARYGGTLPTV